MIVTLARKPTLYLQNERSISVCLALISWRFVALIRQRRVVSIRISVIRVGIVKRRTEPEKYEVVETMKATIEIAIAIPKVAASHRAQCRAASAVHLRLSVCGRNRKHSERHAAENDQFVRLHNVFVVFTRMADARPAAQALLCNSSVTLSRLRCKNDSNSTTSVEVAFPRNDPPTLPFYMGAGNRGQASNLDTKQSFRTRRADGPCFSPGGLHDDGVDIPGAVLVRALKIEKLKS